MERDIPMLDLVIVGAGVYGLNVASTWLALHPNSKILILESSSTLGGSWAQHRVYEGLRSNNMLGTYEYPDFPMDTETFGVKPGEHIPGQVVFDYLTAYAKSTGIEGLIQYNTHVNNVEKISRGDAAGRWKVQATNNNESISVVAKKLVIAAGLTSSPSMPSFDGRDSFAAPILHSYDFPRHEDVLKPSSHILIIGAAKSAWDVAYTAAVSDCTATMLIRPSGNGPVWMAPPYVTPFKLWLEKLVFTRFFTWMSPCIWGANDGFGWVRNLLQTTWLGRKIVGGFWKVLGDDVIELNEFDKRPEIAKLKPWYPAFEVGTALSILNYPTDFFELVKQGKINIVYGEVDRLVLNAVVLDTGEKIDADALVCCTGWDHRPSMKFLPDGLAETLGLPSDNPTALTADHSIISKIDNEILTQYPFLKERPTGRTAGSPEPTKQKQEIEEKKAMAQPFRLYRFMVPPSDLQDRSIAFAGAMMVLSHTICASIQSLWIAAYMDGTLPSLDSPSASKSNAVYETVLHTRYCALRHAIGYGDRFPDVVFDSLPYFDMLLRDQGLRNWRKSVWFKEPFVPYGPADYKGLVGEYEEALARRKMLQGKGKVE